MKQEIKSFYNTFKKDGLNPFELTYMEENYKIEARGKFPIIRIRLIIAILISISILLLMLSTSSMLSKKNEYSFTSEAISLEKMLDLIVISKKPRLLERYLKTVKYEDMQDEYGWTPLHWAYFTQNQEMIDILLKHGADPNIKTTKPWGSIPAGLKCQYVTNLISY